MSGVLRMGRWLAVALVASLAALAATGETPTREAAPASSFLLADEEGADFPGPGPLSWGVVERVRSGQVVDDVRVNDATDPGQLAGCVVQSETHLASYGDHVYVGFNDARQCVDSLTGGVSVSWLGFARSVDGGQTFTDIGPLPAGGPIAHLYGDPVLAVDTNGGDAGTVYIASLAYRAFGGNGPLTSTIAVGRSTDGGQTFTWADAAVGTGSGFQDKEWLAIDNTGGPNDGTLYLTWTDFTDGKIRFSKSIDGGRTWKPSKVLGVGGQGSRPAVGPDGEIHVVWEQWTGTGVQIAWVTSVNGGNSFTAPSMAAPTATTGSDEICGRPALNGNIRVMELPSIAVDIYGSADPLASDYNPGRGTVYAAYAKRGSGNDESDVYLTRLLPGAGSWTAGVRINDDQTTTDQFFPEVAVIGPNRVAVSWIDRRMDAQNPAPVGNRLMAQYLRASDDGGRTFDAGFQVSDVAFLPPQTHPNSEVAVASCYAGDYNALVSDRPGHVMLAWGDNRDGMHVSSTELPAVIPDPNVYFDQLDV